MLSADFLTKNTQQKVLFLLLYTEKQKIMDDLNVFNVEAGPGLHETRLIDYKRLPGLCKPGQPYSTKMSKLFFHFMS